MDALSDIISSSLSVPEPISSNSTSSLGQDEFMKLMLTQMQHQDPFAPTGNAEFISQMAQFSSVTGIDAMKVSLDKFVADQASTRMLDAANLIGRTAMIASDEVKLTNEKPVTLEYNLPRSTQTATASFIDEAGELAHRINLGNKSSGSHSLVWDGTTSNGNNAAPGSYTVIVEYPDGEGTTTAAQLSVATTVESVNLGAGGSNLTISTSEGHDITINEVQKFL